MRRETNGAVEVRAVLNNNRKLKARWTMEAQQDLRSMIDTVATQQLREQLANELFGTICQNSPASSPVNWKQEGF